MTARWATTAAAVTYNGTRQQISQNQPANSVYGFQTANVVLQLGTPPTR